MVEVEEEVAAAVAAAVRACAALGWIALQLKSTVAHSTHPVLAAQGCSTHPTQTLCFQNRSMHVQALQRAPRIGNNNSERWSLAVMFDHNSAPVVLSALIIMQVVVAAVVAAPEVVEVRVEAARWTPAGTPAPTGSLA